MWKMISAALAVRKPPVVIAWQLTWMRVCTGKVTSATDVAPRTFAVAAPRSVRVEPCKTAPPASVYQRIIEAYWIRNPELAEKVPAKLMK